MTSKQPPSVEDFTSMRFSPSKMEAALLGQLVAVESAPASIGSMPLRPQRTVTKTYPAVPTLSRRESTNSIELARISRPATHSGTATPPDLEMSRPPSPVVPDDGVDALQSLWHPYMNRFRFMSACLMNLMNGMSDSASGPLLPYMERYVLARIPSSTTSANSRFQDTITSAMP